MAYLREKCLAILTRDNKCRRYLPDNTPHLGALVRTPFLRKHFDLWLSSTKNSFGSIQLATGTVYGQEYETFDQFR